MVSRPEIISPDSTLEEACIRMKDVDCGALPVGSYDGVEGVITDRDIVVRAIAAGVDPAIALVRDYMTSQVHTCTETSTLQDAAALMHKHNVSRLLIKNEAGVVTGILSFGHILRGKADDQTVTDVVCHAVGRKTA